jgi:hypothetical protein
VVGAGGGYASETPSTASNWSVIEAAFAEMYGVVGATVAAAAGSCRCTSAALRRNAAAAAAAGTTTLNAILKSSFGWTPVPPGPSEPDGEGCTATVPGDDPPPHPAKRRQTKDQ